MRVRDEHTRIRAAAADLCASSDVDAAGTLGQLLTDHVRFEQRELFAVLEALRNDVLVDVARRLEDLDPSGAETRFGPDCARWCNTDVDSERPSMLRRALAAVVLLVVAVLAIRIAIGFVVGVISAVLWIVVVVALVVAAVWAWSTLKSTRGERRVKRSSAPEVGAPAEDPVAVEMRRITEQLRQQGRR